MTTETKNGAAADQMVQTDSAATPDARTVHRRKLAVMAKCDSITPDKDYGTGGGKVSFRYISIQNVSNHLRKFCAEEGLDVTTEIVSGEVIVSLINADAPDDRITTRWPVVDGDKGYAYSIKFPLMRLFLIGDGEEGDEAVLATNSGAAASRPSQASQAPQRTPGLGECETCQERGHTAKSGRPSQYFASPRGVVACNGYDEGQYLNHPKPLADNTAIPF